MALITARAWCFRDILGKLGSPVRGSVQDSFRESLWGAFWELFGSFWDLWDTLGDLGGTLGVTLGTFGTHWRHFGSLGDHFWLFGDDLGARRITFGSFS